LEDSIHDFEQTQTWSQGLEVGTIHAEALCKPCASAQFAGTGTGFFAFTKWSVNHSVAACYVENGNKRAYAAPSGLASPNVYWKSKAATIRFTPDLAPTRREFRKLGLIDYNGQIEVHSSLLSVVLHDKPEINER
jgi:hypothetical protein